MIPNKLKENLSHPRFSKDKEEIFNFKLFYDLKICCLKQGIDLEISQPAIDNKGYDLILSYYHENRNRLKRFQLKTVEMDSTTKIWQINKKFFRPSEIQDASVILRNANIEYCGNDGGVILIEYKADEEKILHAKYYYTDFLVTTLFHRGLIKSRNNMVEFYRKLFDDSDQKIDINKSYFLEVNIEELLTLSRFYPYGVKGMDSWVFWYHQRPPGSLPQTEKFGRLEIVRPEKSMFNNQFLKSIIQKQLKSETISI
jgi:hypothetical protein